MRNISFAQTTSQFHARIKTVTRRLGWRTVKVGEVLQAVEKSQGLKKGEKIVVLGPIEVVDVRREPLSRMIDDHAYGRKETAREGFPEGFLHQPRSFVAWFCEGHSKCKPETVVTRIEFEYL